MFLEDAEKEYSELTVENVGSQGELDDEEYAHEIYESAMAILEKLKEKKRIRSKRALKDFAWGITARNSRVFGYTSEDTVKAYCFIWNRIQFYKDISFKNLNYTLDYSIVRFDSEYGYNFPAEFCEGREYISFDNGETWIRLKDFRKSRKFKKK